MDRYAVIGNPIEHSLSPEIHQTFAKQTGRLMDYVRLLSAPEQFIPKVREFFASGGKGLNVTYPFKQQAFLLVAKYSERAAQAKAVNTLWRLPNGSLYGDNTDGIGLVRDISINRGMCLKNKTILILGAGGAVRGILGPLLAELPAQITVANRTLEKTQQLAQEFAIKIILGPNFFGSRDEKYDVIINCTPVPLRNHLVTSATELFYEINYQHVHDDGFGMLVEQAAESFWLWHGVRPNTVPLQVLRFK
ncbi:MAG: shikimate dehydrogenase [Gammaproteobacteria bacterium]